MGSLKAFVHSLNQRSSTPSIEQSLKTQLMVSGRSMGGQRGGGTNRGRGRSRGRGQGFGHGVPINNDDERQHPVSSPNRDTFTMATLRGITNLQFSVFTLVTFNMSVERN